MNKQSTIYRVLLNGRPGNHEYSTMHDANQAIKAACRAKTTLVAGKRIVTVQPSAVVQAVHGGKVLWTR